MGPLFVHVTPVDEGSTRADQLVPEPPQETSRLSPPVSPVVRRPRLDEQEPVLPVRDGVYFRSSQKRPTEEGVCLLPIRSTPLDINRSFSRYPSPFLECCLSPLSSKHTLPPTQTRFCSSQRPLLDNNPLWAANVGNFLVATTKSSRPNIPILSRFTALRFWVTCELTYLRTLSSPLWVAVRTVGAWYVSSGRGETHDLLETME